MKMPEPNKEYRYESMVWNRLVSTCNLEKKWMQERLGRFFVSQAFLCTLFGALLSSHIDDNSIVGFDKTLVFNIRVWICVVGFIMSVASFAVLLAARSMHKEWSNRLSDFTTKSKFIKEDNFFTFGCCKKWPANWSRTLPIVPPAIMGVVWTLIFYGLNGYYFLIP